MNGVEKGLYLQIFTEGKTVLGSDGAGVHLLRLVEGFEFSLLIRECDHYPAA